MSTRDLTERAVRLFANMDSQNAQLVDTRLRALGATPLYEMFAFGPLDVLERVAQIEEYRGRYDTESGRSMMERMRVGACVRSVEGDVAMGGIAVWLLPEQMACASPASMFKADALAR